MARRTAHGTTNQGAGPPASKSGVSLPLATLAQQFDLRLASGDAGLSITGVCSLDAGKADCLAYTAGQAHKTALQNTCAGAVVVPESMADDCPVATLVAQRPQLAFARIAGLFEYQSHEQGVHATAVIHPDARIASGVTIGAHTVVGAGSDIGRGTSVGANTVLGDYVSVGENTLIGGNVSIHHHVRVGSGVRIEPNVVLGARGFGLVHNGRRFEPIPQLGAVELGDEVEVGAASTIDRGALADTVIEDNVRIDNHVHIAHNCRIGTQTVIAGCTGIAGSCTIGSGCMIGGGVGIGDHVQVTDNVMITAASQVPRDITQPGVWSSTFRAMPAAQWRKLLARFRKLGRMDSRIKRLENTSNSLNQQD